MDVNITNPILVASVLAGAFVALHLMAMGAVVLLERLDRWIEK